MKMGSKEADFESFMDFIGDAKVNALDEEKQKEVKQLALNYLKTYRLHAPLDTPSELQQSLLLAAKLNADALQPNSKAALEFLNQSSHLSECFDKPLLDCKYNFDGSISSFLSLSNKVSNSAYSSGSCCSSISTETSVDNADDDSPCPVGTDSLLSLSYLCIDLKQPDLALMFAIRAHLRASTSSSADSSLPPNGLPDTLWQGLVELWQDCDSGSSTNMLNKQDDVDTKGESPEVEAQVEENWDEIDLKELPKNACLTEDAGVCNAAHIPLHQTMAEQSGDSATADSTFETIAAEALADADPELSFDSLFSEADSCDRLQPPLLNHVDACDPVPDRKDETIIGGEDKSYLLVTEFTANPEESDEQEDEQFLNEFKHSPLSNDAKVQRRVSILKTANDSDAILLERKRVRFSLDECHPSPALEAAYGGRSNRRRMLDLAKRRQSLDSAYDIYGYELDEPFTHAIRPIRLVPSWHKTLLRLMVYSMVILTGVLLCWIILSTAGFRQYKEYHIPPSLEKFISPFSQLLQVLAYHITRLVYFLLYCIT